MKNLFKIVIFILSLTIIVSANNDININDKIKLAKQQDKHIMMFFHIPYCPYCKRMLDENFKDTSLLKEIKKNFVLIDIYTGDDGIVTFNNFKGTKKEFSKHIGAFAFPATIFLDKNQKTVYKSIGYRNIQEHFVELKYVDSYSYKTTSLEEFSEKLEFEKDD